jgi:putative Mg2+ transporter-C (MgtC) family protein
MLNMLASLMFLPDTALRFAVAFALGGFIGFERQWRQRTAGLRTNVLVAVGAAAFADLGMRLMSFEGAVRIIAYIVSGIGFLGAGVIMKEGTNIRGLNTAATLWCSAAVGAFCGSGLLLEAIVLAAFILAGNTLLRPIVDYIDRKPLTEHTTEANYTVLVSGAPGAAAELRTLLFTALGAARYPVRDIETEQDSDTEVELAASLVPTTAKPEELDGVVATLKRAGIVKSASWTVETET